LVIGAGVSSDSNFPTPISKFEMAVLIFASCLYITVSVGFFFYGYYAFRFMSSDNIELSLQRLEERRRLLRKVAMITLVCMGCFVLRAAITLLAIFYSRIDGVWWLDGVYYFFLEALPLLMMLRAYYPQKKHSSSSIVSPLIRSVT